MKLDFSYKLNQENRVLRSLINEIVMEQKNESFFVSFLI